MNHSAEEHHVEAPEAAVAPAARNLVLILWERKSFVVFGSVAGLLLGFRFYLQRKPVYQSVAQVRVLNKRSDALPVTNGDPRLSFYEDYVSTHLVLIRSPLVVERAVKKRNLLSLKAFAN